MFFFFFWPVPAEAVGYLVGLRRVGSVVGGQEWVGWGEAGWGTGGWEWEGERMASLNEWRQGRWGDGGGVYGCEGGEGN